MKKILLPLGILILVTLACGRAERRTISFYPSPTPDATQTPVIQKVIVPTIVVWTTTPEPTAKPTLTKQPAKLCISAIETVYLRPSASVNGYPIRTLENGTIVLDLGGRDGGWVFVEVEEKRGWVNSKYIQTCK